MDGLASELWQDARTAVAFLTRIPMPHPQGASPPNLARAQRFFPIAAAMIGLGIGAINLLLVSLHVPGLAAAAFALGIGMLLTGGLHEDGLADMADGFGGGRDKPSKLAIMRDSRLGTYGGLILIVSFAIKAASIAAMPPAAGCAALVAAHSLARAIIPAMALVLRPARSDGLAASAERPDISIVLTAAGIAIAIGLIALGGVNLLIALVIAAASAATVGYIAWRQIGGVTGDVYGAAEQVAETVVLAVLAARLSA